MSTSDIIKDIFGAAGDLARSLDDFESRSSQIQMALLIWKSLIREVPVVVEAGTGTGKTLGYLVPLIMSGKRSVISTGTKNLQEQIYLKDIPLVEKAIGHEIGSILMKGRKNYLCLHRYNQFFSSPSLMGPGADRIKKRIDLWIEETESGDRAELSWLADEDPVWDYMSSDSDQCLGSECAYMKDCFLNSLRKKAAQSDLIIVNHHLFFADLMVRSEGFGEIIPRFQVAVFDEAHKIEEIATDYFGLSVSTMQLIDLAADVEKVLGEHDETDHREILTQLNKLRSQAEQIQKSFIKRGEKERLNSEDLEMLNAGPSREVRRILNHIGNMTDQAFASRLDELSHSFEKIFSPEKIEWLNWYERRKRGIIFHSSPLDISESMKEMLYKKIKTIIFTSATISVGGKFDYICSRLGIPENRIEGIYPSHFDFKNQTIMYIPDDMVSPNSDHFGEMVAEKSMEILKITSGRALILFTSYSILNLVYKLLSGKIPYTIFKQGDAPRSILLDKFKQDTSSVLCATGSFWQGIDVPGEALSCLIIDKLPFDSPGDPLVAARIESIRARGRNPFMEYQLPSAIISLKQGLGRLIRKSTDRGVISILDTRIIKSRYGRFFLESLPEIPVTRDLSDVEHFF